MRGWAIGARPRPGRQPPWGAGSSSAITTAWSLPAAMVSSYKWSMVRTRQCGVIQIESNLRGFPGEFLRLPVRWVTASGPRGLPAASWTAASGVIGKPAAEGVVEAVDLGGSEELVISWLAVEDALSGVPVGAGGREVGRVDVRRVGVGPQQDRPGGSGEPVRERDGLARLDDAPAHAGRRVVGDGGQRHAVTGGLGDQDALWQRDVAGQPYSSGRVAAAGDSHSPPPGRPVVRLRGPQVDSASDPVKACRLPQGVRRSGVDLLQQRQVGI